MNGRSSWDGLSSFSSSSSAAPPSLELRFQIATQQTNWRKHATTAEVTWPDCTECAISLCSCNASDWAQASDERDRLNVTGCRMRASLPCAAGFHKSEALKTPNGDRKAPSTCRNVATLWQNAVLRLHVDGTSRCTNCSERRCRNGHLVQIKAFLISKSLSSL